MGNHPGRTPDDHRPLRVSAPKKRAAGIPAVISSAQHGIRRMGVRRTWKTLRTVNQLEGFDCPGCAWPDPEHRSGFEFCENGAKAVAEEAMSARFTAERFASKSIAEWSQLSDYELGGLGRLTQPVHRRKDHDRYESISWDDALDMIGERLNRLDDPDRAVFYTSGRTSNEAAFLYQLMVRSLGTNNLPDCSNMCHESSGKALGSTIGIGKGTVRLSDFSEADVIVVIGQNPGTNHPRMLTTLRDAKRNGARIIHVNPLPETGLERFKHPQDYMRMDLFDDQLADLHLPVRIGGDAALLQALQHLAIKHGAVDTSFIDASTSGFDALAEARQDIDWQRITEDTGLDQASIESAANMLKESKATIACWAMGLTQHRNGVAVIQEVVNLLLLGGHIGRPGAGLCPVRGHSNVQGDRTVGIWESPTKPFLDKLEEGTGVTMPRSHGYDVVNAIRAMETGGVDVLMAMGGNLVSAAPDTERTASAIGEVELVVHVSTKPNRSHLIPTNGDVLILPCLGRTEIDLQNGSPQFVTVENSMGIVHRSQGRLDPASKDLRSEPWIVAEIAARSLGDECIDWRGLAQNYDGIRDLIEASIAGFDAYNERVRSPKGFELPNPPRDNAEFDTASGLAEFTLHDLPDLMPRHGGSHIMMTLRSHDQYNTTIYGLEDRYRGVKGNRRVVFMNAEEMAERGWKTGHPVDLIGHWNGQERRSDGWLLVPYAIPKGNLASYFPEANVLVPLDSTAAVSNTPTSKWIEVSFVEDAAASPEEE
ncbi:MAG: FdhF/YdeP family oxidoreductase [Candidatus Thermoplasmatota archaeon]|nr:FdhF/YdeP family oxidoreductase [Candidatus Thermoplasmatota archaeon]MEC8816259.1 FdhF/YdeP family oxidoreductase [Candidatus Thermoplasmatota archaeon]